MLHSQGKIEMKIKKKMSLKILDHIYIYVCTTGCDYNCILGVYWMVDHAHRGSQGQQFGGLQYTNIFAQCGC